MNLWKKDANTVSLIDVTKNDGVVLKISIFQEILKMLLKVILLSLEMESIKKYRIL